MHACVGTFRARPPGGTHAPPPWDPRIRAETSATSAERRRTRPTHLKSTTGRQKVEKGSVESTHKVQYRPATSVQHVHVHVHSPRHAKTHNHRPRGDTTWRAQTNTHKIRRGQTQGGVQRTPIRRRLSVCVGAPTRVKDMRLPMQCFCVYTHDNNQRGLIRSGNQAHRQPRTMRHTRARRRPYRRKFLLC